MENDLLGVYQCLAMGVDLEMMDEGRCTILHSAVMRGKTNLFCLEMLIQAGAKVRKPSRTHSTLLITDVMNRYIVRMLGD